MTDASETASTLASVGEAQAKFIRRLAMTVIILWGVACVVSLVGCFLALITDSPPSVNTGVAMAVVGVASSTLSAMTVLATIAVNYFCGSSSGSKEKSDTIQTALVTSQASQGAAATVYASSQGKVP